MSKFEKTIKGDIAKISDQLNDDILNSAFSMNLVEESYDSYSDSEVIVKVYDKYYMRNSSRASLTLTIFRKGDNLFISAIGSGGGTGAIIRFDWGAENDLTSIVEDSLYKMGY
ncbi:MAG: DUF6054 family protein [Clostridia bacterium]|jgi:hypothetical protein